MTEPQLQRRLGTAEWASPEGVAQLFPYAAGKFWLGRSPLDGTGIGYSDDRHICLVSGSRAGKGTTSIVPNLCLWPGSLVCIDPKGENASVTAARRGAGSDKCDGLGQAVYVLDPFHAAAIAPELRASFNPLDALSANDEELIDEAWRIADALVVINPESKDPYWDESARSLIKGLILHIVTSPDFEGRRTLITLRELIARGDIASVENLRAMGETEIASAQALLWEGVRRNTALDGVIAGIGDTFSSIALNAPKQFESILQVANRNTEFVDSPGMRRCLAASDFKLSDLKTAPAGVSLYLSLPQRYMSTHYRWLRMMIALTVTEMERVKGPPVNGHRVLMCLDEFAGLRRMEIVENAVAQIAGNGVKLMFVLQSLEQLKATYKDRWETFLSNCGLKIFFGLEDHFTREYVSKFIGETEIVRQTQSGSESEATNESRTHTEGTSTSTARNESTTRTTGTSRGRSGGTNESTGSGTSTSSGSSWKRALFFFRGDKQFNEGGGRNTNRSRGSNLGWSDTTTQSLARSLGFTVTEGSSVSDAVTSGTSQTTTRGYAEVLHKRPLVSPDEIGGLFRRIDDQKHPAFPGVALVLVSGESPLVVQRVTYHGDGFFRRQYHPHPDHPKLNEWHDVVIAPTDREALFFAVGGNMLSFKPLVKEGGFVRKGAPFLAFNCAYSNRASGGQPVKGAEELTTEIVLHSPVEGHVKVVGVPDDHYATQLRHPDVGGESPEAEWKKVCVTVTCLDNRHDIVVANQNKYAVERRVIRRFDLFSEEQTQASYRVFWGGLLSLMMTVGTVGYLRDGEHVAAMVCAFLLFVALGWASRNWFAQRKLSEALARYPKEVYR